MHLRSDSILSRMLNMLQYSFDTSDDSWCLFCVVKEFSRHKGEYTQYLTQYTIRDISYIIHTCKGG